MNTFCPNQRFLSWSIACALSLLLLGSPLRADDWPAWKGANRDSLCKEKGLLKTWPLNGPPLAWKITGVGEGYSSPAIVGNMLYLTGHKEGKQWLFALDVSQKGKQFWTADYGPVRHDGGRYPGARETPAVDGDRIYLFSIAGELVCMDRKDGKQIWRRDIPKEFQGFVPRWGYAESPLVDGPLVICTPGGKENTILALNKMNGERVWGTSLGDETGYASIIKATIAGVEQYINLTSKGVIAVDAQNGKFLWRYDAPACIRANCTTCIVSGNSIFAAGAYDNGGGRADSSRKDNAFEVKEVFFTKKMQNHHGGVVLVDGMLYGSNNPNELTCIDFQTGEVKWTSRRSGKCSVLYADGMLFCRDEKGPISLVTATSEGYRLRGRFEQPDRSPNRAWPHLVIANGMLYVRDQDTLLCCAIRESKQPTQP